MKWSTHLLSVDLQGAGDREVLHGMGPMGNIRKKQAFTNSEAVAGNKKMVICTVDGVVDGTLAVFAVSFQ